MTFHKPHAKKAVHHRRKPVRKVRSKFGKAGTTSVNKDNYACSVEAYQTVVDILPNQAYAIAPRLIQFPRSQDIATNYQHYRCVSVHTKFEPLFNNYLAAPTATMSTNAPSVPQLFYQMNRSGTQPSILNLKWFEENGSKPMKLTTDKVIKYKPNTSIMGASPNAGSGVGGDTVAWDKWVNTYLDVSGTASSEVLNAFVPFYGHLFWVDQLDIVPSGSTTVPVPVARMIITTKWEFNKPYAQPPTIGVDGATQTISL